MPNTHFQFKQFIVHQDRCAMKVTTDACLFGAWVAERVGSRESGVQKVLDIGAGTGLLSLMLAQKISALIDTVEIEENAFGQAKENVQASPWAGRINVFHGDVRKFVFPSSYDSIISNPPFYENELKSPDKKKNIAHHGGLALSELLDIIGNVLAEKGEFFLLLPYKRNDEAEQLIQSKNLSIIQKKLVRQSVKHDYFRIMICGTRKKTGIASTTSEISIWNDQQQYTPAFTKLLEDYYLHI